MSSASPVTEAVSAEEPCAAIYINTTDLTGEEQKIPQTLVFNTFRPQIPSLEKRIFPNTLCCAQQPAWKSNGNIQKPPPLCLRLAPAWPFARLGLVVVPASRYIKYTLGSAAHFLPLFFFGRRRYTAGGAANKSLTHFTRS